MAVAVTIDFRVSGPDPVVCHQIWFLFLDTLGLTEPIEKYVHVLAGPGR